MSKRTGPTRIPLFGSRIPVPGQAVPEPVRIVSPVPCKQPRSIIPHDVGKKVRVGEKEGVLRFVGSVHFAQGVWCGVELRTPSGKNDGLVRGVRYFACPDYRGLMAPLPKVQLADDPDFEEKEDLSSGPHSMLLGLKGGSTLTDLRMIDTNVTYMHQTGTSQNNNSEESNKRRCEDDSSPSKVLIRSDTYEALDDSRLELQFTSSKTVIKSCIYSKPEEASSSDCTFEVCPSAETCTTFTVENRSYLNENNFPDIINSNRVLAKLGRTNKDFSTSNTIADNNITVLVNKSPSKIKDINRQKHSSSRDSSVEEPSGEGKPTDVGNTTRVLSKNENNTSTDSNETVIGYTNKSRRTTFVVQDVERRKTGTPSSRTTDKLNDTVIRNCNETFVNVKTKSFRLSNEEFVSPPPNVHPLTHSTPVRASEPDVENSPRRRVRPTPSHFSPGLDDDGTKRDSLEFEESLGILTPEQMADVTGFAGSRTPSSENIGSLPNDLQNLTTKFHSEAKSSDLCSPNLVDASLKDLSLGIIDEHMLSNFTMKSDTTMNMELPLDSVDNQSKDYTITRLEQTPSPEDLPLDPPVIENESKTEPTKSKTTSSFITSITSITSLDTGYQGDGEMSRPASRGPDHSPLTRRPLQRPQPRRPDPMTDSDFYTESDADNHEEHPLRGDRLARVIDGTLYGVDPQAAADIYVNNRENMDSSGIFTDIEGNTRADELSSAENENQNENPDVSPSPSDTSSKTISNDSQNNAPAVISRTPVTTESNNNSNKVENMEVDVIELPQIKRKSPSPSSAASSPASVRSPRHTPRDESTAKKYKMPKRNVASKVKAVLESSTQQNNKEASRTPPKKTAGRWDAVMNKISKAPNDKPNLKEIKSKVFAVHSVPAVRQNGVARTTNPKLRRTRTRAETATTKGNNGESLHSSASDLSGASPAKRIGSSKKRAEVVRVTQVLTAAKLSPRSPHKNTAAENKKNVGVTITANDIKSPPRRTIFSSKEKKQTSAPTKDCGRATVKGGRASPGARPPQQTRAPATPAPRTTEALAILVQHLVFNLEAFRTPSLKKQVEKSCLAAEEARFSYRQLEETLSQIRLDHAKTLEEERSRCRKDIAELIEQHRNNIAQLNHQHTEAEQRLLSKHENTMQELMLSHNDQLLMLRAECNKLQKTHEQTLEILREENDSIREEIDEKNAVIDKLEVFKKESEKLEKDYKIRELRQKEEVNIVNEEIARLKDENVRIMHFATEGKENKLQIVLAEVESLRAVLELKQTEVADLRRALAEVNQKAEQLPSAIEKVSSLTARCEDLQSQLEQKSCCEHQLLTDNKKLQESLKEEFNHSKRLVQHNEELQWKLQQNKEVLTRVLEQAEETAFNRSLLTSSYNERHNSAKHLERATSFRDRSLSNKSYTSPDGSSRCRKSKNSYELDQEDFSPPSSPKVKGVVEKSDSVSYVLEMEESPEMIASRIVRRSFRNSTPPKTTPTKSPANKRPRMKNNPLSLSASASAILPALNNRGDHSRSRSASMRNGDMDTGSNHSDEVFTWHTPVTSTPIHKYSNDSSSESSTFRSAHQSSLKLEHNIDLDYNDDDIKLPALPSEIGRKNDAQSLPVPKHLAGEAMLSESNSEDESTTSSSSGLL